MNRRLFFVIFSLCFQVSPKVHARPAKLTPFQKNIQACLEPGSAVLQYKSLRSLYDGLNDKYILVSSVLIEKEVVYKVKEETRKLKLQGEKLQVYRIADEENAPLTIINNDARQSRDSLDLTISQLLNHADVQSDWAVLLETRAGGTLLRLTTLNKEIKSLILEKQKLGKKLECKHSDGADICLCVSLK